MNNGPVLVTETNTTDEDGVEIAHTVYRHWGVELRYRDAPDKVYLTRWDPGYGSGVYVLYDEADARADLAQPDKNFTKHLVTRLETTTVRTTPWKQVD